MMTKLLGWFFFLFHSSLILLVFFLVAGSAPSGGTHVGTGHLDAGRARL